MGGRWGAAVCCGVFLVAGIRFAAVSAAADLPFFETWYQVLVYSRAYKPLDEELLDAGQRRLEYAVQVDPGDAKLRESLALIEYWRSGIPAKGLAERMASLDNALSQSTQELSRRPASGYGYAVYALIKQQRGERDVRMLQAFHLAAKYGPNESRVQDTILDVGIRSWNVLSRPEHELVTGVLSRALQSRPRETTEFLKARKPILPACSTLKIQIEGICG